MEGEGDLPLSDAISSSLFTHGRISKKDVLPYVGLIGIAAAEDAVSFRSLGFDGITDLLLLPPSCVYRVPRV